MTVSPTPPLAQSDLAIEAENMDAFELYCIENGISLQRFSDSDATKTVEAVKASALEEVEVTPTSIPPPFEKTNEDKTDVSVADTENNDGGTTETAFDSLFGDVSDDSDEDSDVGEVEKKVVDVSDISSTKSNEDAAFVAGGHNVHVSSRSDAIEDLKNRDKAEVKELEKENEKLLDSVDTEKLAGDEVDEDADFLRKAGQAKTFAEIAEDEYITLTPEMEQFIPYLVHERADVREMATTHIASLTGTSSGRLSLLHTRVLSKIIPLIDDPSTTVIKQALISLINLSQLDRFRRTLASLKLGLVPRILQRGFGKDSNSDGFLGLRIMLLANLTSDDAGNRQFLELHRRKRRTTTGTSRCQSVILAALFLSSGEKPNVSKETGKVDLNLLSIKELRALIKSANLESNACVTKRELQQKAEEANEILMKATHENHKEEKNIGDIDDDRNDVFQHAGHCLLNAARIKEGREVLLRKDSGLLLLLVRQLRSSNRIRRLGVIGTLKNLCWHMQYDDEIIEWMLEGECNEMSHSDKDTNKGAGVLVEVADLINAERIRLSRAATASAFALGDSEGKHSGKTVSEGGHINAAGCDPRVLLTAFELIVKVGESPNGFEILCVKNLERTSKLRENLMAIKNSKRCGSSKVIGTDGMGLLNAAISMLDPARAQVGTGVGGIDGPIRPGMIVPLEAMNQIEEESDRDGTSELENMTINKDMFAQMDEMD